jgi:galactokinase
LEAFGPKKKITPEYIAQKAYEIEVLEHGSPGGKMDQFTIGLGNIIYLETGEKTTFQVFRKPLPGLIIGESGIPKDTIGLLAEIRQKTTLSIQIVQENFADFKIEESKREDMGTYLEIIPKDLITYFKAAIINHDITQRAFKEFKKVIVDLEKIGTLMTEHHDVLKNLLGITVPKIDRMIEGALNEGAYGAKIVGSGGGGSIVALAPEGKEQAIIDEIVNVGGKAAYLVSVNPGARLIKNYL